MFRGAAKRSNPHITDLNSLESPILWGAGAQVAGSRILAYNSTGPG